MLVRNQLVGSFAVVERSVEGDASVLVALGHEAHGAEPLAFAEVPAGEDTPKTTANVSFINGTMMPRSAAPSLKLGWWLPSRSPTISTAKPLFVLSSGFGVCGFGFCCGANKAPNSLIRLRELVELLELEELVELRELCAPAGAGASAVAAMVPAAMAERAQRRNGRITELISRHGEGK